MLWDEVLFNDKIEQVPEYQDWGELRTKDFQILCDHRFENQIH